MPPRAKTMKTLLTIGLLLLFVVPESEARGRLFGRRRARTNQQCVNGQCPAPVAVVAPPAAVAVPVAPVKAAPTVDPAAATDEAKPAVVAKPVVSVAQAHAQREANIQAQRGRMYHALGCAPGTRFSGVGYGPTPNCGTCVPRRSMTLVADAVAYSQRTKMFYRSRHWR